MDISFHTLFMQHNSSIIEYQGKTVHRFYEISNSGNFTLRFTIIEKNSVYNQAIVIFFNQCKGVYTVHGKTKKIPNGSFSGVTFWEDTISHCFDVDFSIHSNNLIVCNGSDPFGDKTICRSLYENCAMIITNIGKNKFRFYCNDHELDDDFNDFIFDMEIIQKDDPR